LRGKLRLTCGRSAGLLRRSGSRRNRLEADDVGQDNRVVMLQVAIWAAHAHDDDMPANPGHLLLEHVEGAAVREMQPYGNEGLLTENISQFFRRHPLSIFPGGRPKGEGAESRLASGPFIKLPGQDSNLDKESQNLLCYRYTTG
jgi:hypothetical protein